MTFREERLVRRGAEESPDTDAAKVRVTCRVQRLVSSAGTMVWQYGQTTMRPRRGSIDVKLTSTRSSRTARSSDNTSPHCGHRAGLSRRYVASPREKGFSGAASSRRGAGDSARICSSGSRATTSVEGVLIILNVGRGITSQQSRRVCKFLSYRESALGRC